MYVYALSQVAPVKELSDHAQILVSACLVELDRLPEFLIKARKARKMSAHTPEAKAKLRVCRV